MVNKSSVHKSTNRCWIQISLVFQFNKDTIFIATIQFKLHTSLISPLVVNSLPELQGWLDAGRSYLSILRPGAENAALEPPLTNMAIRRFGCPKIF